MNAVVPLYPEDQPVDLVNFDAEQAYLGACLHNNAVYHKRSDRLKPGHFADPLNGRIYEAIGQTIRNGASASPITLKAQFDGDEGLANAGGSAYLVDLAGAVVTVFDAEDYADVIIDMANRRRLRDALLSNLKRCRTFSAETPTASILDDLSRDLGEIGGDDATAQTLVTAVGAIDFAAEQANDAYKRGGIGGLSTGLLDLDRAIGGLHAPDMVVLAGRPGMGKTALADTMALGAAKAGAKVAFFTLEMSNLQQGQRLIAAETGITVEAQRSGQLTPEDFQAIADARAALSTIPLWFDDDPTVTVERIEAKASRLKRTRGLDLLIIDYLQLVRSPKGGGRSKLYEEVTDISRGVKALAKTLAVPILVLSQLSRDVEKRDDKRPGLSDLRESGAIEQDADSVWFVYREEYYLQKAEPKLREGEGDSAFADRRSQWETRLMNCSNVAEIQVAKNRHGPTRRIMLRFNGPRQRFEDLYRGGQ